MAEAVNWTARGVLGRTVMQGRLVRLEPLAQDHADDLFAAAQVADAEERFRWLPETPPEDLIAMAAWVEQKAVLSDPMFFAVVDQATGQAVGRQALMRNDVANGVIEIGNIYWGPGMARKAGATEALYLFMRHAFEDLGYRRFEWKCNNDNLPSKRAAERFGFAFEGVFRQHMIVKGLSRDTAWFAIIDKDWPRLQAGYEAWLDRQNFDAAGRQRRRLQDCLADAGEG
jgi:RimJ/RimL family protein N-acetyltransferase